MAFDNSKLPDSDPLSLCQMVTFLAWGEAMSTDEIRAFGYPAERAQQSEWEAQFENCYKQAWATGKLTAEDDERRKKGLSDLDPSGLVLVVDESWPPVCQQLRQRWIEGQHYLNRERPNLARAAEEWRQAARDGRIIVSGLPRKAGPNAQPVEIPRAQFRHYRPDWESDSLEPNWKSDRIIQPPRWFDANIAKDKRERRPKRWFDTKPHDDVQCCRESFTDWLAQRQPLVNNQKPEYGPGRPMGIVSCVHDPAILTKAKASMVDCRSKRQAILRARDEAGVGATGSYADDLVYDRLRKKWGNNSH